MGTIIPYIMENRNHVWNHQPASCPLIRRSAFLLRTYLQFRWDPVHEGVHDEPWVATAGATSTPTGGNDDFNLGSGYLKNMLAWQAHEKMKTVNEKNTMVTACSLMFGNVIDLLVSGNSICLVNLSSPNLPKIQKGQWNVPRVWIQKTY